MSARIRIIVFVTVILTAVAVILSAVWYRDSSRLIDTYVQSNAQSLMKDAYNAFSYLLTDTEYLSSLVIMNRENIITPLEIINADADLGLSQLTHRQLVNKRIIDAYIGSLYGHKYYITGISISPLKGYNFKVGNALYYPGEILNMLENYGVVLNSREMVLFPPIKPGSPSGVFRSDYVVPAVRGIDNPEGEYLGYTVFYFDYNVIEEMFSNNLPEGSKFEVTDRWGNTIYSNIKDEEKRRIDFPSENSGYARSYYYAEKAGWSFNMAIPTDPIKKAFRLTMRNTFALLVVIALTGIILSFLIKKLTEQISSEEKKKRKAEMDFLQAQINPHFISNTLNTIVWMARMNGADNIANLTRSLIALLHLSMKRGADFITIKEEIDYIKNYVEIQKCCSEYDFEICYKIDPAAENLLTLRFILQPIVENALIHSGEDERRIEVSAAPENGKVRLDVRDDGKGMAKELIDRLLRQEGGGGGAYSSIGLKNIHERIQLFFGKEYGLSFDSREGEFTRVIVYLPVIFSVSEYENGKNQNHHR